jgi:energy-converting hydrogenase Eha subunit E
MIRIHSKLFLIPASFMLLIGCAGTAVSPPANDPVMLRVNVFRSADLPPIPVPINIQEVRGLQD